MKLSTEQKSHVAVFYDGSYKYITSKQAETIFDNYGKIEGLEIDGNFYQFKAIQKVLTYSDFANEYPGKISKERENDVPVYTTVPEYKKSSDYKSVRALKELIKGINQFIEEHERDGKKAENARKQREEWKLKLKAYAKELV